MRSFRSTPICPSCIFAAKSHQYVQFIPQPWAAQRFLSGRARAYPSRAYPSRAYPSRAYPSRMVLSDEVARPSRRDGQDSSRKPPRRRSEGPFGGMNRTSAGIREPVVRRGPRISDDRSSRDRSSRDRGNRDRNDSGRRIKAMKMQGALATVSYGLRTRTKERMTEVESFEKFNLLPSVQEAMSSTVLKGMVDIRPTPIQRLAIPALLGQETGRRSSRTKDPPARQEFLLAAETGSGKTLAYLLPVVQAFKKTEAADATIAAYREYFSKQMEAMQEPGYVGPREFDPHPTTGRPRVIVLVPTAELVDQVGGVAKALSHVVKFKTILLSANVSAKVIHARMYSPTGIDLIVTTPHLLASLSDSDPYLLSRVSHLVIDEADSLFDRSFSPVTTSILDRALPSMKQLILCSATIPKKLDTYVGSQFPNMVRLTTPNLHAIPRRVQLGVIDVTKDPYRNRRDLACADAIWTIGKDASRHEGSVPGEVDVTRIMVFVNEREKTQELADYLVSKGIDAVALHRDTSEQRQSEMLGTFTTTKPMKAVVEASTAASLRHRGRHLPNTKVIVATDLASRGIDTLAVRHVILYDVPHSTIDFIHRLGRAGRMGRRGRGIVLVGKHDRRDIVAEVRESMYMGQALI
ncbi:ATP-dependent RNA helicase mrh-4 [Hypoxylon sp. NC1633]|nr:ATP-dependent RNA helicase mrh-4 [Hypoxylon sp. NC1633]